MLSIFSSLLPRRYRSYQIVASYATISGIIEFASCLALLIYRYLQFVPNQVFGGTNVALKAAEQGGESAIAGSGIFTLAEFMLRPLTIALVYFAAEGIVRGVAAFTSGEVLPTLPLAILAYAHEKFAGQRAELALGPRVQDEVEVLNSSDLKLRVRSCRPKPSWDERLTIFYMNELYELAGQENGQAPRKFVYVLRRKPDSKLVRGTFHYDPNEVMSS
jgi:hypothetical protein